MAVVIIDHARRRMPERGVSEDEVREVLARGQPAEAGAEDRRWNWYSRTIPTGKGGFMSRRGLKLSMLRKGLTKS